MYNVTQGHGISRALVLLPRKDGLHMLPYIGVYIHPTASGRSCRQGRICNQMIAIVHPKIEIRIFYHIVENNAPCIVCIHRYGLVNIPIGIIGCRELRFVLDADAHRAVIGTIANEFQSVDIPVTIQINVTNYCAAFNPGGGRRNQ